MSVNSLKAREEIESNIQDTAGFFVGWIGFWLWFKQLR